MSEETLFTAARRIVRFIRVDDQYNGGLLGIETIRANEMLARIIEDIDKAEKAKKSGAENGDH